MTLIDTGDFYGMGSNELLIGEALKGRDRDSFQVSVKFGAMRGPDASWNGYDARPAALKNFLAYTLTRLGLDHIDIYRPARLDPNVPIEETVGAIKDMIDAGYVRHVGLSEVGSETIRKAALEAPISDLQIEYSLMSRGIEDDILPICRVLGIGVTAYGVLSRGMLGGGWKAGTEKRKGDIRGRMPRYDAGNEEKNLTLVDALTKVAKDKAELDEAFLGRLMAVGRANRIAVEDGGQGLALPALIRAAIGILPDHGSITIETPELVVGGETVMPLALVLNELATNTLKHNAAYEDARLSICGRYDTTQGHLVLEWRETRNAPHASTPSDPERIGFGTQLIQLMVEGRLDGTCERKLDETGFLCTLRLPTDRIAASADPAPPG